MKDVYALKRMMLPIDNLLCKHYRPTDVDRYMKFSKFCPFRSVVTLDLVKNTAKIARDYIIKLLQDKEQYGYLYFLNTKKLMVPLDLQFNAELIVDPAYSKRIIAEMDRLAKDFSCQGTPMYEITRIELLYFYVLLVNPRLNWITVDYLLRGNRVHDYLIAHPNRLV